MLAARKLSKRYGGVLALDALDLEVAAGEVFCLLGPNGAGKTTTLSLFLGFTRPSSGEARVASALVDADPIAARRRIAYVPEQVRLYPHLTGCENLAYFLSLSTARLPPRDELAAILVAAGLPESAVHRPASGYSKGMRQKVVLALSQAKNAGALLLDEPTSGLDPGAVRELCAAIRREGERGAAVLMVTHDLGAVASIAHRIGVMKAGRLVEVTPAAHLSEADALSLYRRHLGAWIGWCVLLPALVNVALVTGAPARGGVELTLAQREEMNAGWDRPKRATLDPFFARRPEWDGTAVPEDRFSWPWYYAMHEVGDAHVAGELEVYHAALARRERWTTRAALALPPLALQLVLDRMAGTDMASELAFRDSIAAYHEQMKQHFYPLVFNHEGLSAFDLDAVPRHRFQGVERPVHLSGLAGLFGVLALLGALLPLAARRIDAMPEPEKGGALVPAHGRRPGLGRGARAPRRAAGTRGGAEGVI